MRRAVIAIGWIALVLGWWLVWRGEGVWGCGFVALFALTRLATARPRARAELAARMAKGVPQANGELAIEPLIDVKIVGQSVLYMANLPLEANVLFHTIMATKMPFVGRG